MTPLQRFTYWLMGLLRIARSPNQLERILALVPDERARGHWCRSEACACCGCINRSEWLRVRRYRITESEHRWWSTVRAWQREIAELPGARQKLLYLMRQRPVKADTLRMFPPCT